MPKTAENSLKYDLPSIISRQRLSELGVTDKQDLILTRDVSAHVEAAFREVEVFFKPALLKNVNQARCDSLKRRFVAYIEASLTGNPYPGEHYSVAQARQLLQAAEKSVWTPESIESEVRGLKAKFEESLHA